MADESKLLEIFYSGYKKGFEKGWDEGYDDCVKVCDIIINEYEADRINQFKELIRKDLKNE